MSNYSYLNPDIQDFTLQASKQDRIDFLYEPLWINYPKSEETIQLLSELMNRPKRPRMQNLLIIGEANMGKTSLVTEFAKMYPDTSLEDNEGMTSVQKHVLLANLIGNDEKDLYISILEKMWSRFSPTESKAKLRHQVLYLMRECNVKILILDEIHNLLSGTASKQRIIMNTIKNLSNELMIPIVGVGTQDASMILVSDPQHASRFDVVRLAKWSLNKEFGGMLHAFEKNLPLQRPSLLHKKEKAILLYGISSGNLGNLHRLIIECAKYAIEEGIEEITLEIIEKFKWVKPTDTRSARELSFDTN